MVLSADMIKVLAFQFKSVKRLLRTSCRFPNCLSQNKKLVQLQWPSYNPVSYSFFFRCHYFSNARSKMFSRTQMWFRWFFFWHNYLGGLTDAGNYSVNSTFFCLMVTLRDTVCCYFRVCSIFRHVEFNLTSLLFVVGHCFFRNRANLPPRQKSFLM